MLPTAHGDSLGVLFRLGSSVGHFPGANDLRFLHLCNHPCARASFRPLFVRSMIKGRGGHLVSPEVIRVLE